MKIITKLSLLPIALMSIASCSLPTSLSNSPSANSTTAPTSSPVSTVPQQDTKIEQLKQNTLTFQTTVETYGVDWAAYPKDVQTLYDGASRAAYFKDFKNPYTAQQGPGINGSFIDLSTYQNYTTQSSLKGLVVYESIKEASDVYVFYNAYKIYSTDETGALIKDANGKVKYLSN